MHIPPSSWNPWAALAERVHLKLRWVEHGRRGCINFATREIQLRRSMAPEERRCVLSHELVHDERGPVPRWLTAREESAVRLESARRLIGLDDLADALLWSSFITEVAEQLAVDVPTLQARLTGLSEVEREQLTDRMAGAELLRDSG